MNITDKDREVASQIRLADDHATSVELLAAYREQCTAELRAKGDRLKKNIGCARNQGSTQFCAEAVELRAKGEKMAEALRYAIPFVCFCDDEGRQPDNYPESVKMINDQVAEAKQAIAEWEATK